MADTIETVFRTIISVNQLSINGAVSDLCDEYSSCQARTGRLVVTEQSDPLFELASLLMTTPTPLTELLAQEKWLKKKQRTSGKALTTGPSDQNLYGCRILDNSWSRTVLHDKGHWRVLTIYRISGLSRVHFAKRWKIIWPERLDWRGTPKLGPCWKSQPAIYKVNMEWKLELNLKTKTNLTSGSESLMGWISWSRTWATTRRTTTTSRKPPRCSSTILRWNRMHVLLQAEQRLKQNHENVLLPAHLQELFLSVKDLGLIMSQKLIRLSLSQCQNAWLLFFVMVNYRVKKMERLNSVDSKIIFGTILRTPSIGLM